MQSFSAMNFTTTGGSILARGWSPSASSSRWNGLHYLLSVFRLTSALSASCCFDIAFIIYGLELQIIDKISSWFWKMWLCFSHRFAFGELKVRMIREIREIRVRLKNSMLFFFRPQISQIERIIFQPLSVLLSCRIGYAKGSWDWLRRANTACIYRSFQLAQLDWRWISEEEKWTYLRKPMNLCSWAPEPVR